MRLYSQKEEQKAKRKARMQRPESIQRRRNWYKEWTAKPEVRQKIRSDHTTYCATRRVSDIKFKLAENLRNRLNTAIENNWKVGSAIKDLGCSIDELKIYLESKFQPGMTWENWGVNGWHIDHIKPLVAFNLSDPAEFSAACHYTNLQPLWAVENLVKGTRSGVA